MAITGLWSRLQGGVIGVAIGTAMRDVLAPVFEPLRQEAWHDNPNRVLSPQTLAQLVAMGVVEFGPALEWSRREGFDTSAFRALVEGQMSAPPLGQAMEAFRRGSIDEPQFRHALTKASIESQFHGPIIALRRVLPSVTDLVRMAVREVFDPQQRDFLQLDADFPDALVPPGEDIGLEPTTLRDYWAAHWELPSYQQLAEMRFRGLLTAQEFRDALKAIDYAPTWRDRLEAIARRIPTVPDFTRMAVREVYDPASRQALGLDAEFPEVFAEKVALHGMSHDDAEDLWAAHWRLPSARQGYQMVWRGEMPEAELRGLLKALDYPPLWRERLFNIAYIVPGRIDLKRMLRHGILDRAQVKAGYERIGYHPTNAELMTQIAEAEVGAASADSTWLGRARTTAFTRIHSEFVARQLSESEAGPALQTIGVPATEVDRILDLWNVEAAMIRTELTQAQIVKAFRLGRMTEPEALAELEERGMSSADAALRLAL